jgi:hypothetical protein
VLFPRLFLLLVLLSSSSSFPSALSPRKTRKKR